jgi:hypothetical protein
VDSSPPPRSEAASARLSRWNLSPLALLAAAVGLGSLAACPARWTLATTQGNGTWMRWAYLAGGLLTDVTSVGPFVAFALLLLLLTARRRPRLFHLGFLALAACLLGTWLAHNGAMEFRFQRGIYPGPMDAREGLGHADFVRAELPALLGGRFLVANLVAATLGALLLRWTRKRLLALAGSGAARLSLVVLAPAAVGLFLALFLGARRASAFCESLHNRGAIASPASTLVGAWLSGNRYDGSPEELRREVSAFVGSEAEVARGARHLGFPEVTAVALRRAEEHADCTHHPLARDLDEPGSDLVEAARAVSRELFRGSSVPPRVFQVSLESLRADDIASLHPAAPPQVTPFLNHVYDETTAIGRGAAAFHGAHQSGIRTAQALSGVLCGIGALPFHIALGRDFGNIPLRCAPDVLAESGFRTRAVYGHEFVFDDMGTFLRFHGMDLFERRNFDAGRPRGVWDGVSDESVYDAALRESTDASRAQYTFVLTLSNHTPYTTPADLGADDAAEMVALCKARQLSGENCDRLKTVRYADQALGHFARHVEEGPDAARTIVLLAADHTTHEWEPWERGERPEGITQIPAAVWLPRARRDSVADPARFAAAWGHFQELAQKRPISNADLPTLLLALLSESREARGVPQPRRWHTLGGQSTSTSFESPTGEGVLFGIDAHAQIFDVTSAGKTHPTGIVMDTLRTGDDVQAASPLNRPVLAFWGTFLRGFAARCTQTSSIRLEP